jgi:hypothetical protein
LQVELKVDGPKRRGETRAQIAIFPSFDGGFVIWRLTAWATDSNPVGTEPIQFAWCAVAQSIDNVDLSEVH